jgi:copper transport protein
VTAPPADRRVPPRALLPFEPRRRAVTLGLAGAVTSLLALGLVQILGEGDALGLVDILARWIGYTATLLTAGGLLFTWLVHRGTGAPRERETLVWIVQVAAAVGVFAALAGFAVHTAALAGVGAGGLLDHHSVGHAGSSGFGASVIVRILGLVYISYAVARLADPGRLLVGVGGVVFALGSMLLIGHTASAHPRLLVVTAGLAHTLAASAWLGGLVLLGTALRFRRSESDAAGAARLVARFSTLAAAALALLTVAGIALAWAQLRSLGALIGTAYGRVLLVKLAIVGHVALVAAYNHRTLVPATTEGGQALWALLARTVRWEVLGIVVALAVTAILVNLDPAGPG